MTQQSKGVRVPRSALFREAANTFGAFSFVFPLVIYKTA